MWSFLTFSVILSVVMRTSDGGTIYDNAVSHEAGVLKTVNGIEFDNISRVENYGWNEDNMSSLTANYPDPGFWTKTSWIQIGYGVWVNLSMVGIGLAYGFSAVTIPQLSGSNTEFMITQSQEAWIASIINLSSPIGCIINGYLMDKFGRRFALILCSMPTCIGWIYTSVAKSSNDIIIGRLITGLGTGMAMGPPRVYLTEITLPNMRGVVGAFPNLAISIGITTQASLGSLLYWRTLSYICSFYTSTVFVLNFFLPETPYFLLMRKTVAAAKCSLKKFRSKKYNLDVEIEEMIDFKTVNDIRGLSMKGQLKAIFRQSSCKAFWIVSGYIIITQMSGVNIIIMWTVDILKDSRSTFDAYIGNITLGITRMLSGILVVFLLFRCGKKHLSIISGLGVGVSCIVIFVYLGTTAKNLLPLICWNFYILFASLGHYALPCLVMSEMYPLQIRGFLSGITVSFANLLIFIFTQYYPTVRNALGFANTVLAFGVSSIIGCIFLYFYLPETKDLTLQEIEEYFNKRRATLVSQRQIISRQVLRDSRSTLGMNAKSTPSITKNRSLSTPKTKDTEGSTANKNLK